MRYISSSLRMIYAAFSVVIRRRPKNTFSLNALLLMGFGWNTLLGFTIRRQYTLVRLLIYSILVMYL
ncbi:hypothetical protein ACS0TY_017518 [Phlomoides rotata]